MKKQNKCMSRIYVGEDETGSNCTTREDIELHSLQSATPKPQPSKDSRMSMTTMTGATNRSSNRNSILISHHSSRQPHETVEDEEEGHNHDNNDSEQPMREDYYQQQNNLAHDDDADGGKYHTHKYLLYFTDPATEQRYFNFQYIDCLFIPGKLFFATWTIVPACSFVIYTDPIADPAYTASTFSSVWWMGGYISTAINLVLGIGLFVDRLKMYREVIHLANLFVGWPTLILAILPLKRPDTNNYAFLYGVFMFTAVITQCRLHRSVLLITVWPLVCMFVTTFAIEEYWETRSKIEMLYWAYCCSPAVLVWFLEKRTRQSFVEREVAMASIEEIEHKTAVTQRMIANFFPATPTRDLLQQLNGPRDKAYEDTVLIVTDIAGFTAFTTRSRPSTVIAMLTEMFRAFELTAARYGVEKIATVGDSYCGAVFQTTSVRKDVRCTDAIQFSCGALNFAAPLELRIGVHIGDVVGVFVGHAPPKFDLFGPGIDHTRIMEESGRISFVHVSTSILTTMELSLDSTPEWPQTDYGILCTYWDHDRHRLMDIISPPNHDDQHRDEVGGAMTSMGGKDVPQVLLGAEPAVLNSGRITETLCVFAGISNNSRQQDDGDNRSHRRNNNNHADNNHSISNNSNEEVDSSVVQYSNQESTNSEVMTLAQETVYDDDFSKFFLTFNSASVEILYQRQIAKQGVNIFCAKLFTFLAALLFIVQILVQCGTDQDKAATATLFAIILAMNLYTQLIGTNHRFHGAITFIAYHAMFFIAMLALTAECDGIPNRPRYIANVAVMYMSHAVFAPQYCLNVKLVHRCLLTCASAFLLASGIAIRRNTIRDEVAQADALSIVIFPFLIMSFFPEYSLRSAFRSGLQLRRLQRNAKSRGAEMATSALSIMLPTFVTEKIVALAKESKTSRLRRAAARGGAEGLLLADEDAQIDFLSTSSHTQDAAGDIDFNNMAATWEYSHVIIMFAKFYSPDTQSFTPSIINSTVQDVEGILQEFHVMKVKTIGSTIMIVAGIDDVRTREHQLSGIIDASIRIKNTVFQELNLPDLEYRIGIHSGPCFGAILGGNGAMFDLFGDTVNTASRMMTTAQNRSIHMSAAAHSILPPELASVVEARQPIMMKGKGKMLVFAVMDNGNGQVNEQHPSGLPPTPTTHQTT